MPHTHINTANCKAFVDGAKNKTVTLLYHMTGCPHCDIMRPAWESAVRSVGPRYTTAEVEYGSLSLLPSNMRQVRGFPTVLTLKNGVVIREFTGDRSESHLKAFIADSNPTTRPKKPSPSAPSKKAPSKPKRYKAS